MYRISVVMNGTEYTLHDPRTSDLHLINPTLDLEMGKTGSLSFQVPPTHANIGRILPLSSEIYVYKGEEILYRGRPVTSEEDFYLTGTIKCEGDLAYLLDSIQRPYEFTGGITPFLQQCLNVHNQQVESKKQFLLGNVTVVDDNNYINRSNSEFSSTMKTLSDKLADTHGGYFKTRHVGGNCYLDYVYDYGGTNSQTIRFAENIIDLSKSVDPSGIITALIPQGAELEDGTAVDIKSVNGGLDYIYSQDGVEKYGWIWGTQKWEDVTVPENLKSKAEAYLNECLILPTTLEVNALDLSLIDVDMERLKLGLWTKVESKPHGISALFMLKKLHIDITNPERSSAELGRTLPTFTGSTNKKVQQISRKIDRIAHSVNSEVEKAVQNATELITGGKGGYFAISYSESGTPEETLWMDAPQKELAQNIIRINKNGIGFSTTGINGPYRNAWTIDGHFVADFITVGSMFAERIKGGTLTMGGAENGNGVIKLLDASGNQIGTWSNAGLLLKAGAQYIRFNPAASNAVEIVGNPTYWDTGAVTTPMVAIKDDLIIIYEDASQGQSGIYAELNPNGIITYENGNEVAHYGYDIWTSGVAAIDGDLNVSGEKNRVVKSGSYGEVKLAAYETPSPMFGDIGSGIVAEDGLCYVQIDPVFSQVVNTRCEYQVNIQEYGAGTAFVSERGPAHFIVRGTPGLQFGWELKAKQKGYEQNRMDRYTKQARVKKPTYAEDGAAYYQKFVEGMKS